MPKFEVGIMNEKVAQAVARGERHSRLDDRWADTHYIEFRANDQLDLHRKIDAKYPSDLGYIVTSIDQIED